MSFKITKQSVLPDSEYEIEGEIHADVVKEWRDKAVKELALETRVSGFRPGHAPEKFVVERFGELGITEEAGRMALEKHYGEIVKKAIDDKKIKVLGSPAVTITKVAPGEAFGFKIKTALMPEVKVKGYKATAKKIMSEKTVVEVTDKDINDAVADLQKQVAHTDHHKNNPDEGGVADHSHHDHGDLPLPEVNDEFIKKFGPFEAVEAFKQKIKEGITAEKNRKEKDKKRLTIMDELIKDAEITMPKMLVESELGRMVHELSANISQMGLNVETYLKHISKTIDELKAEWVPDAEKRAKTQLVLNQIALDEKITVSEDEIKKEVAQIMQVYKDADPTRAEIYVETVLLNEKVWKWLEEQGK
jgi:FKBP-type peptidyl-prolyl cis-trans isomerase (trigger factor)